MKFAHIGDLHLGKSLGDFDLIEDQKYMLDQILSLIRERDVDGILIAGDVYDKALPSEAAVNLLDYFLKSLAEAGVKAYMISGNHDSDDRLNFGSSLFQANHIYISSVYNGTLSKYTVQDEYGAVNIYLLPFVKASQVRHFYSEETIDNYEDAVRTVIRSANIDPTERNVLVAHQFVTGGGEDPALGGSEGVGTVSVGLVEKIGYRCFDDFDYVALGHIHSPQHVGKEEVRYSGSILKYSLSEVDNEKSIPIITLGEKGKVEIELVPLRPLHEMRHLRGTIAQLLSAEHVTNPADFIYATLTDEDYVNDAMGIFQQTYPHTVKIDYDNSHTRAVEQVDINNVVADRSFSELIRDFYQRIYQCEISPEEMNYMRMVAREAGVMDETD